MEGLKLKFLLQQIGLSPKQFGKMAGKSESTIRRWTDEKHIGVMYEVMLEEFIGKKRFALIEVDWQQLENERYRRIEESKARSRQG